MSDKMKGIPYVVVHFDEKGNVTRRAVYNRDQFAPEEYAIERMARVLLDDVREFFSDPEHIAEYQRWEEEQGTDGKS